MKARLLGLLFIAAPASADPGQDAPQRYRRTAIAGHSGHSARRVPTGATDNARLTTNSTGEELPTPRASVDSVVAHRVLAARISPEHVVFQRSIVERPTTWMAPMKEFKPWQPKIMLYPMRSMVSGSGGKGVKVKFRF